MSKLYQKPKGCKITQKLKIELQSLFEYACYDNPKVLLGGNSMKKPVITDSVYDLYMPSNDQTNHHVSNVDLFLQGKGHFRPLFGCNRPESSSKADLVILHFLHNIPDTVFHVSPKIINRQLLTSKSLSNNQDMKAERVYIHAKEVEAN